MPFAFALYIHIHYISYVADVPFLLWIQQCFPFFFDSRFSYSISSSATEINEMEDLDLLNDILLSVSASVLKVFYFMSIFTP